MIQKTHMVRRLSLAAALATLVVLAGCADQEATAAVNAEGPAPATETAEEIAEAPPAEIRKEFPEEIIEEIEEAQNMTEPETAEPISEPKAGDPRPGLLVTTEWLVAHGQDAGILIVDAREAPDYAGGHLPGAVNIARSATFDPQSSGNLGKPGAITELFGSMGIDESVHVVLYDQGQSTSAARIFWTLEQYGHAGVSVLDGGIVKWQAEGRELTEEVPTVATVTFSARPGDLTATMDHVLEGLDDDMTIALDTRSDREWDSGRVPGAVHIEWTENFTEGDVPVYKSVEELTALYEGAGVTKDHRIHTY